MLKDTQQSYGWLTICLHWLTTITVLGMFALGLWMVGLDYYSPWYNDAPHYHKSIGLLLAAVLILRLLWKLRQVKPAGIGSPWAQRIATIVHAILYLGLLSLFATGYLISTADGRGIDIFNWLTLPSMGKWFENQEDVAGDIHEWLAYVLMAFVSLHALAALKHHFVNKDATLKRMIKPLTQSKDLK